MLFDPIFNPLPEVVEDITEDSEFPTVQNYEEEETQAKNEDTNKAQHKNKEQVVDNRVPDKDQDQDQEMKDDEDTQAPSTPLLVYEDEKNDADKTDHSGEMNTFCKVSKKQDEPSEEQEAEELQSVDKRDQANKPKNPMESLAEISKEMRKSVEESKEHCSADEMKEPALENSGSANICNEDEFRRTESSGKKKKRTKEEEEPLPIELFHNSDNDDVGWKIPDHSVVDAVWRKRHAESDDEEEELVDERGIPEEMKDFIVEEQEAMETNEEEDDDDYGRERAKKQRKNHSSGKKDTKKRTGEHPGVEKGKATKKVDSAKQLTTLVKNDFMQPGGVVPENMAADIIDEISKQEEENASSSEESSSNSEDEGCSDAESKTKSKAKSKSGDKNGSKSKKGNGKKNEPTSKGAKPDNEENGKTGKKRATSDGAESNSKRKKTKSTNPTNGKGTEIPSKRKGKSETAVTTMDNPFTEEPPAGQKSIMDFYDKNAAAKKEEKEKKKSNKESEKSNKTGQDGKTLPDVTAILKHIRDMVRDSYQDDLFPENPPDGFVEMLEKLSSLAVRGQGLDKWCPILSPRSLGTLKHPGVGFYYGCVCADAYDLISKSNLSDFKEVTGVIASLVKMKSVDNFEIRDAKDPEKIEVFMPEHTMTVAVSSRYRHYLDTVRRMHGYHKKKLDMIKLRYEKYLSCNPNLSVKTDAEIEETAKAVVKHKKFVMAEWSEYKDLVIKEDMKVAIKKLVDE